jgi:hypothetical protein
MDPHECLEEEAVGELSCVSALLPDGKDPRERIADSGVFTLLK